MRRMVVHDAVPIRMNLRTAHHERPRRPTDADGHPSAGRAFAAVRVVAGSPSDIGASGALAPVRVLGGLAAEGYARYQHLATPAAFVHPQPDVVELAAVLRIQPLHLPRQHVGIAVLPHVSPVVRPRPEQLRRRLRPQHLCEALLASLPFPTRRMAHSLHLFERDCIHHLQNYNLPSVPNGHNDSLGVPLRADCNATL